MTKTRDKAWKFWLISLGMNIIIMVLVMHFTDLYYETNDDYSIGCKIVEGYPYVGFVNYYLCSALIVLQKIFTEINVFILSQIVMSFVAFTAVYRVFIERRKDPTFWLLSACVIALFSFDHYSAMQFTKTSALLMVAGLVCVADAYTHEKTAISYIGGFLLYVIGTFYRQMGMFPAISYIFLFMLAWWTLNGREFFKGKKAIQEIVIIIAIIVLLVVPYGIDKLSDHINSSTPELAAAREYQSERIKITDYPLLKYYNRFSDEYEVAGFSENDIYTIDRFVLDYDGVASYDNLKRINEINSPALSSYMTITKAVKKFAARTLKSLRERSFTGIHIIVLVGICVLMLFVVKPKGWVYMPIIGILTVALYIVIYYMQRTNYRAFYVADISASFWLLYTISIEGRTSEASTKLLTITSTVMCMFLCVSVVSIFPKAVKISEAKAEHNTKVITTEEVETYLNAHPDCFYVMPTPIQKWPSTYLDPLAVPEMQSNCTNTGGWETLTPSRLSFLAEHGVSNPVKDLIDSPHLLLFGKYKQDMMLEYYNKWYGEGNREIDFEKVDEVDDIQIFKVVTHEIRP